MPVRYEIDPQLRLVRVVAEGPVSYEDDRDCLASILGDPRHREGFAFLVDHRRRAPAATADHVRAFASAMEAAAPRLGRVRFAVVVERDVSYGLARMFSALTGDLAIEVEIFRSIEDAEAWLGRDPMTGPVR